MVRQYLPYAERRQQVIDFMRQWKKEHQYAAPSLEAIANGIGYSSRGTLKTQVIDPMIEEGILIRPPGRYSGVYLVEENA